MPAKLKFSDLSQELQSKIKSAMQCSWDYVAYDYLELCEGRCTQEEAIEGAVGSGFRCDVDADVEKALDQLSWDEIVKVGQQVFMPGGYRF
jgi:hypothetical protein